MAEELQTLLVKLDANIEQFRRAMKDATKSTETTAQKIERHLTRISGSFKKLGAAMRSMGQKMSLAVTAPIAGLATLSAHLADVQIQAETKLAAALRFAGNASDKAVDSFKEFARGIQEITTVGDETTLAMAQTAISMGLTEEQAKRASQNAIGLSKAFGIAETSAVRYTAGLEQGDTTMLNRYIPTLRNLKDDTERVAAAQKILGDAFQIAVAEAKTGLGPLKQLQNQFGDFLESVGNVIIQGITPLIEKLKGLVSWLQELSPKTKTMIVIFGGLAATIGPAVIALGFLATSIGAVVKASILLIAPIGKLGAALGLLISPIGLTVAAIAGLIAIGIIFQDKIIAAFSAVADFVRNVWFKALDNSLTWMKGKIADFISWYLGSISKMMDFFGFDEMSKRLSGATDAVKDWGDGAVTIYRDTFDAAGNKVSDFAAHVKDTMRDVKTAVADAVSNNVANFTGIVQGSTPQSGQSDDFLKPITISVEKLPTVADAASKVADTVKDKLGGAFDSVGDTIGNAVTSGKSALKSLGDAAHSVINQILSSLISSGINSLIGSFLGGSNLFGGARAEGGPVSSGKAFLVGERGPELFVPKESGQIISNKNTNTIGKSINVNVTVAPQFAGNAATRQETLQMAVLTRQATLQAVGEARRRSRAA